LGYAPDELKKLTTETNPPQRRRRPNRAFPQNQADLDHHQHPQNPRSATNHPYHLILRERVILGPRTPYSGTLEHLKCGLGTVNCCMRSGDMTRKRRCGAPWLPPQGSCAPIEHLGCKRTTWQTGSASLEECHGDESRTIMQKAAARSTSWRTTLATDTLILSQVVHKVTEKRSPQVML
jgi:hypothetical protein